MDSNVRLSLVTRDEKIRKITVQLYTVEARADCSQMLSEGALTRADL
jgi:hypothetical protein